MEYKDDDYLTTQQVAEKFSIHAQTVYRRRKAMELFPQFKSGIFMNGRRFRYKEIRDFMQFVNTPEYKQELKKRQSVIKWKEVLMTYTYIVNPETGEILFDLVHDLITQNIRAIKLIAKKLNAVLR